MHLLSRWLLCCFPGGFQDFVLVGLNMLHSIVLVPKTLGVCIALLTLPALVVTLALDPDYLQARQDDAHWVASWTSMPQLVEQNNLPPASFVCTSSM